jgi:predicted transcriptional regulator of viral defense system
MYIEFKNHFDKKPLISLVEIQKAFPKLDKRRLTEWSKKGYIENVKRGFYRFTDQPLNQGTIYFIANKIYKPSYISLESALAVYQIIPEVVFSVTSISSLNTTQLNSSVGNFRYNHLKENLFFGYELVELNGLTIALAKPEKAILDYLYLHSNLRSIEDFEGLRWNKEVLKSFDFQRFSDYLQLFNSNSVSSRFQLLLKYMHA